VKCIWTEIGSESIIQLMQLMKILLCVIDNYQINCYLEYVALFLQIILVKLTVYCYSLLRIHFKGDSFANINFK